MCWTSSSKALVYAISSPSEVAACSYLTFSWVTLWVSFNWVTFWMSFNWVIFWVSFNWITFWVSLNWTIFWVSVDTLTLFAAIGKLHGDTYINLPSMAMPIAIHICCVPIAKLNNKCSQMYTFSNIQNSNIFEFCRYAFWQLKNFHYPWKCSIASCPTFDKGDSFDIWKSRKGQKNLEHSV